jgi:hypothetical protein
MNTKAIMNAKAAVVLFSLILAACGGGSSDGGGENAPAEVAPHVTHSTNISGIWINSEQEVIVTINQAVSDSAESPAQALTVTVQHGADVFALTGTKSGDTWSASGTVGNSIVSIEQTLSSATNSSGTLKFYDLDTPEEQTLISVSLTKS